MLRAIFFEPQPRQPYSTPPYPPAYLLRTLNMPPMDIISIPSEDEDDEVQIIAINKRHRRKRRKVLDSIKRQADLGNNDQISSEAPLAGVEIAAVQRIPERARNADIPASKFTNEPVAGRSRSAPHEFNTTTRTTIPASFPYVQTPQRSASTGSPFYQSSSSLHDSATSTTKQPYPTPRTASSSNNDRQFVDFLSSSPLGPENGTGSTAAGRKSLIFDARTLPQASPGVVRAATLSDPFDRFIRTEIFNPFTKRLAQARKESGHSLVEQAATSRASRGLLAKSVPQTLMSSSLQHQNIESIVPKIKDSVAIASGRGEQSSNSKKRKRYASTIEQTTPQPPVRNRILWSIPAFTPTNEDHGEPLPHTSTAKHTANSTTSGPSTPAASQESTKPKLRKTWTSKMYADLAQQLQQCFPFTEFAKRHSRSESEVFDVFSAVVQLPLLQKSSTGLSRVSRPGRQSMKTFKNLMKEAKTVLAQEKKKEKELKKDFMKSGSSAENKGFSKTGTKTPSQGLLDIAVRAKSSIIAP